MFFPCLLSRKGVLKQMDLMTGIMTGISVFVGIVVGVIVQVAANWFTQRWQRSNAIDVLKCEIELNLTEVGKLKESLTTLRQRISAGQVSDSNLYIDMSSFDYSAMNPLVHSGYFHKILGSEGVQRYLTAVRLFNNSRAEFLTTKLAEEHAAGSSLAFLDWFEGMVAKGEQALRDTGKKCM